MARVIVSGLDNWHLPYVVCNPFIVSHLFFFVGQYKFIQGLLYLLACKRLQ
jgi:hypothetical protein